MKRKVRRFLLRHCVIVNETLDALFWIALIIGGILLADWFLTGDSARQNAMDAYLGFHSDLQE